MKKNSGVSYTQQIIIAKMKRKVDRDVNIANVVFIYEKHDCVSSSVIIGTMLKLTQVHITNDP